MRIGIDLGGSHVGIGLINGKNEIIRKIEENLTADEKKQIEITLIEKIRKNTQNLLATENITMDNIEKVGIACPRNNSRWNNNKSAGI